MNKWEIWTYPFPSEAGPHPVVIISPQQMCANTNVKHVNALACRSLRADMQPKCHEIVLNGEDGMDGRTVVDCSLIHIISKNKIMGGSRRGLVTPARRSRTHPLKAAKPPKPATDIKRQINNLII